MCPSGSYVMGNAIKFESWGWGDNTALNNLRIYCGDKNGNIQGYTLGYGYFGSW